MQTTKDGKEWKITDQKIDSLSHIEKSNTEILIENKIKSKSSDTTDKGNHLKKWYCKL